MTSCYLYNNLSNRIILIEEINKGDYYYSDMPIFLTNTKSLPISIDPFIFTQLYRGGWFSFFRLEELIKNKRLKNIILSKSLDDLPKNSFYNKEMRYLFDKYYIFKNNISDKFVYQLK